MPERSLKCPQCNAPLAPSRFARSLVCPFCGSTVMIDEQGVPASRFRAAFLAWNAPATHGFSDWVSLGERHWAKGPLVARGEVSDVYAAARARLPTERALLKVLRDPRDVSGLDNEWEVLTRLRGTSSSAGFSERIPQPVARGRITAGALEGSHAILYRWADGFVHTFEDVRRVFPRGIEPRASIWIWRRILEILSFLHGAGVTHGAVLPAHLLVQEGEHGVRLVGFRQANGAGSPTADVVQSARCVADLLGDNPAIPGPLADEIERASQLRTDGPDEAWAIRERLGKVAREAFGPPAFCPLRMPRED
ncbi:MAG: hypothetical protein ACJ75H_11000 [Thermoanaerobaculia bacterium]